MCVFNIVTGNLFSVGLYLMLKVGHTHTIYREAMILNKLLNKTFSEYKEIIKQYKRRF